MRPLSSCLLCVACLHASPARAAEPPPPPAPVSVEWHLRLRHEHVDDKAFVPTADADTARLRAGLRFRLGAHVSALLEGEGVANVGDGYNSTANGRTAYPVVADAAGAEPNQAWLAWKHERLLATVGRQRLLFDNQRWIGNSGWRQNEQTFDAVALEAKLAGSFTARYAWLDRAHRVNGDDARDPLLRERALGTHLFHLAWQRTKAQAFAGYAWLHEDRDVPLASTATFGLRSVTSRVRDDRGWGLSLEWARQQPHAANPLSFAHGYWWVEPSLTRRGITWKAGWEHLGGNGRHALQTPLATLHAFNGWADKFNTTPPGGLDDVYIGANGTFAPAWDWQVAWHDYRADEGGTYGSEWNASLGFPVGKALKGLVKLADYRADGFARDTQKAWLQLEWVH